ncbi:MAG: Crp/Fnr family transcriptional regulator [Chloroflexi bacterium]|nr:Crp/Fnr family transcriptional regulator [Chloroflexota bacterium]
MLKQADQDIVANCELVRDLEADILGIVLAHGRQCTMPKGAFFFHQGEDAKMLYVIVGGRVKLTQVTHDGQQIIVDYFGSGSGLGIIVALSNMAYPLSVEAVEDCTAVSWHRDEMKQLMLDYPQLAMNGMEMIGRRFAKLQDRFRELSTKAVEQRVARTLLRLVRQFGKRVDNGILIDIPLSRQDLAEMTGTNLYNVSRILSKWQKLGYVANGRKRVILCKSHEIVIIAEGIPQKK